MEESRSADPIDVHVGGAVRARRKTLGVTQEALADRVGLTFQQVQKYERGFNRVSASKLYAIAGALGCEPGDFFAGLPPATEGRTDASAEHAAFVEDVAQLRGLAAAVPEVRLLASMSLARRRLVGDLLSALAD